MNGDGRHSSYFDGFFRDFTERIMIIIISVMMFETVYYHLLMYLIHFQQQDLASIGPLTMQTSIHLLY